MYFDPRFMPQHGYHPMNMYRGGNSPSQQKHTVTAPYDYNMMPCEDLSPEFSCRQHSSQPGKIGPTPNYNADLQEGGKQSQPDLNGVELSPSGRDAPKNNRLFNLVFHN